MVKEGFSKQDKGVRQRVWREAGPVLQADVPEKQESGRAQGWDGGHRGWTRKACVDRGGPGGATERASKHRLGSVALALKTVAGDF